MKNPKKPLRLVVLDLDGTTLNTSHELNPATVEAIKAVSARGVRVVLASGRLPHSIAPFARTLGLDGFHLGLNGGVAFDLDLRFRHKHVLSVDQMVFGLEVLKSEGLGPMIFGAGGIWVPQITAEVDYVLSYGEPAARIFDPARLDLIPDPIKILAVLPAGPRDQVLTSTVEPRLHAVRTGPTFFEFMAPGVTKGAALTELMADLKIGKDEVMAVGDSENDASLFMAAGFSVAMGNAVPALKAQADVLTGTNADDGVAQALRKFILDFDGQ